MSANGDRIRDFISGRGLTADHMVDIVDLIEHEFTCVFSPTTRERSICNW